MRASSTPSRAASPATVAPWLNAAARPPAACPSEGTPTASPPPTDSAAPAVVIVASELLTRRSSESVPAHLSIFYLFSDIGGEGQGVGQWITRSRRLQLSCRAATPGPW